MAQLDLTGLTETSKMIVGECHVELKRCAEPPLAADEPMPKKCRRPAGPPKGFISTRGDTSPSSDNNHIHSIQSLTNGDSCVQPWDIIANAYNIHENWKQLLLPELCCLRGSEILAEYERRAITEEVYPPKMDIFAWTRYCAPESVKAVIVGQDPYANPGQAHGLAFSVKQGVAIPPSLKNILLAVKACYPSADLGNHGCLEAWSKRGVLLLNSVLTVKRGDPGSHYSVGWQFFIRNILRRLSSTTRGIVFMLWGAQAQTMYFQTDYDDRHLVLKYSHPSPLSRKPFATCTHFKEANDFLSKIGRGCIDWSLTA